MRISLLIFFLFLSTLAKGQVSANIYIDSLKQVLQKTKEDTVRVMLYSEIANEMVSIDPNKALPYAEEGLKLAKKIQFKRGMAYCAKNIGLCYHYLSNYPKALEYMFEALKYVEKGSKGEGLAYSNIAGVYADMEKSEEALKYYFRALSTHRKLKLKGPIPYHLTNIGSTYSIMGEDSLAVIYLQEALTLYSEPNAGMAGCLSSLGGIKVDSGNYDEGIPILLKALKINEDIGDNTGIMMVANNLGAAYMAIAFDTAKLKRSDIIPPKHIATQRSYDYLQRVITIATELGELRQLQKAYETLSQYYSLTGNQEKAFETFKLHTKLRDSILSEESGLKIESLENQHELDMKKKEIELRNKEIELHKLTTRKKRNENYFLLAGVGLLSVVVFVTIRERKKSEKLLLNVLPHKIAARLKKKEHPIADYFQEATIVFIDMAEFTHYAELHPPKDTVQVLDAVFTKFDAIAEKYGLEKIKTIGDCYMAVSGLPEPRGDHAIAAAKMALEVKHSMLDYSTPDGTRILFRIGLDCGSVVAGVIGKKKFIYDLWGDSVNMASRMESTGIAGQIQCTDNFKKKVEAHFTFASRGLVEIKGKGKMETWLLQG